jgi:hypothetical protein
MRVQQAVIQMGFVTTDLERSLDYWIDVVGAGPFFYAEYAPEGQVYRGQPTVTKFRLAYGYSGDMNIEVVQQSDDAPSAYTELLQTGRPVPVGGLFHHVMIDHDDYDAIYQRYLAAGAERCFDALAPGGMRYCYLDARRQMDCYVELIEHAQAFAVALAKMREARNTWDGSRPRRDFEEIVAQL